MQGRDRSLLSVLHKDQIVEGQWADSKGRVSWYDCVVEEVVEETKKKSHSAGVLIGWLDQDGDVHSRDFFVLDGLSSRLRVPKAKVPRAQAGKKRQGTPHLQDPFYIVEGRA